MKLSVHLRPLRANGLRLLSVESSRNVEHMSETGPVTPLRVDFREPIEKLDIAFLGRRPLEAKSAVLLVEALDANGVNVTSSCRGVVYSKVLGGMYAYLPAQQGPGFNRIASLEFAEAATSLEVKLLTWPGRQVLVEHAPSQLVFQATVANRGSGSRVRTVSVIGEVSS